MGTSDGPPPAEHFSGNVRMKNAKLSASLVLKPLRPLQQVDSSLTKRKVLREQLPQSFGRREAGFRHHQEAISRDLGTGHACLVKLSHSMPVGNGKSMFFW